MTPIRSRLIAAFAGLLLLTRAHGADPGATYHVREAFIFESQDGKGGSSVVKLPVSYSDADGVSMKFDLGRDSQLYLYVTINRVIGWEPVAPETVFREEMRRAPRSPDEVQSWQKKTGYRAYTPSNDEAWPIWKQHIEHSTSTVPGFKPKYADKFEDWTFIIDAAGKVLSQQAGTVKPAESARLPRNAISEEENAWFNANVPLPEFAGNARTWKYNAGHGPQTVDDKAFFYGDYHLGTTNQGDEAYLLRIRFPFSRASKHTHGTGDEAFKVLFLSLTKKVVFSAQSYEDVWMSSLNHDLYEMYRGPYSGLVSGLDEPVKPRTWILRIWSAE